MAFSTSGKRDDISVRLRAQNGKSAQQQTKQLEKESRKMEERLQEIKLVMGREKEERERHGGGFWKAGQTGSLGSYGKDTLAKPVRPTKEKGQKARKIKVLKEEQIALPTRSRAPGTMGYIASRGAPAPRESKVKGPKCGQCEDKGAQVSCLECGEDYCAGCFAAFHLKGALKKHRSVPMGSNGARTPRGMPLHRSNVENQPPTGGASGDRHAKKSSGTSNGEAPDAENPMKLTLTDIDFHLSPADLENGPPASQSSRSGHNGSSLLEGTYDEAEAAVSFQQALKAWRTGDSEETGGRQLSTRSVSPVRTPRVQVESGTSMPDRRKPIEIKFSSGLSYAEKLLLKQHRRAELGPLPDGGVSSRSDGSLPSYRDPRREGKQREDTELSYSERVDFQALYDTVRPAGGSTEPDRSESRVSIIELNDVPTRESLRGMEHSSRYHVEVGGDEDRVLITEVSNRIAEADSSTPTKKRAFMTPPPSKRRSAKSTQKTPSNMRDSANARGNAPAAAHSREQNGTAVARQPNQNATSSSTGRKSADWQQKSAQNRDVASASATRVPGGSNGQLQTDPPDPKEEAKGKTPRSKATPRSKSRTQSRSERRPQSRAKSRAASRLEIFGEGTITKTPSLALRDIAHMSVETAAVPAPSYTQSLGEFFTVGVGPSEEFQERTLTPSTSRPTHKDGRWKISNKCYQMAPRSWRPDSSLSDAVTDADAMHHLEEVGMRHYREFEGTPVPGEESGRKSQVMTWSLSEGQSLREMTRLSEAAASHSSPPESQSGDRLQQQPHSARSGSGSAREGEPNTEGRQSRMIVMDGDDLSIFDGHGWVDDSKAEDEEALDQLEYELASQTGRLTEDGKISRLSCLDPDLDLDPEEQELGVRSDDGRCTGLSTPDRGFDIRENMNEDDLMDDFEEMEALCQEDEVKALH